MNISRNYQGFTFGVLFKELKSSSIVVEIQEPRFKFRTSQLSAESLRNLFKHLDLKYPRDTNLQPLSYTKLTTQQLNNHQTWIYATVASSGYEWKN